jgi:hypothetical protein
VYSPGRVLLYDGIQGALEFLQEIKGGLIDFLKLRFIMKKKEGRRW